MRDRNLISFATLFAAGVRFAGCASGAAVALALISPAGAPRAAETASRALAVQHIADKPAPETAPGRLELSRDQAMWAALAFEDAGKLAKLLELGADPNKADELSQMTPLMASETLPIAKVLVDAGANPNLRDRVGRTALHHAAKMREGATIIELLVRAGGDVNARANDAALSTPLMVAVENYLEDNDRQQASLIIRALAFLGADVNLGDARGNTALVIAAKHNQPELIRLLLELGADPARPVVDGRTPLDFARELNATDAIQALAAAPNRGSSAN
jgi:ankyrin repeat protein